MKKNAIVLVDPEIMGGTPCFAGTRVPARTLIDYLEGGDSLGDFLEDFPTVSREQAVAFLEAPKGRSNTSPGQRPGNAMPIHIKP